MGFSLSSVTKSVSSAVGSAVKTISTAARPALSSIQQVVSKTPVLREIDTVANVSLFAFDKINSTGATALGLKPLPSLLEARLKATAPIVSSAGTTSSSIKPGVTGLPQWRSDGFTPPASPSLALSPPNVSPGLVLNTWRNPSTPASSDKVPQAASKVVSGGGALPATNGKPVLGKPMAIAASSTAAGSQTSQTASQRRNENAIQRDAAIAQWSKGLYASAVVNWFKSLF